MLHINNMERRQALNELMRQEQNPQEQYEEKAVNYLVALTFRDLKKRVNTATQQRFQTLDNSCQKYVYPLIYGSLHPKTRTVYASIT